VTLIELLVAILIMAVLAYAMVQLLSTGMTTWKMGEMRRGAYERAQFIFNQISTDLASLYAFNPAMPGEWSFQADTLYDDDYDGTGHDEVAFTSSNISVIEDAGVRYLKAGNPSSVATVEYTFTLPVNVKTILVQPKITLVRSAGASETCVVHVDAKSGSNPYDLGIAQFASGLRDQTITPNIDVSRQVSAGEDLTIRLRIVPSAGGTCDARLFEASQDAAVRPVFRVAVSPETCQTGIGMWSGYVDEGPQALVFVRSARGLKEVAYYTVGGALRRAQRDSIGGSGSYFDPGSSIGNAVSVAKGVIYFGCEFQNQYNEGAMAAETETNRKAAVQTHWNEADSVPPYVRVRLSLIPLSGAKRHAYVQATTSAAVTTIRVDSTKPFFRATATDPEYVKIGKEWIEYTGSDGVNLTGCTRGARGTLPAAHNEGDMVLAGEEFFVNIPIATWGYRSR
jgi:hypothetical protein